MLYSELCTLAMVNNIVDHAEISDPGVDFHSGW